MLRISRGAAFERLGGRAILFSAEQQHVVELNDSSALLASRLECGASRTELQRALEDAGVDPGEALVWVDRFLLEMAAQGLVEADPAAGRPAARQDIRLCGLAFALEYGSDDLARLIAPAYGHLEAGGAPPAAVHRIDALGPFAAISADGGPARLVERSLGANQWKALLLEAVLAKADHALALHAACVSGLRGAALLFGSPGAGKTTLALTLAGRGHRLGGDDVALLHADGTVAGIPLASAVKESGWAIAQRFHGLLDTLPVHHRPDGQSVRFLPPSPEAAGRMPIAALVRLRRGDQPPGLVPLAPMDALGELLRESRAPGGRCTRELFALLTNVVRATPAFELFYADANEGAELLARAKLL